MKGQAKAKQWCNNLWLSVAGHNHYLQWFQFIYNLLEMGFNSFHAIAIQLERIYWYIHTPIRHKPSLFNASHRSIFKLCPYASCMHALSRQIPSNLDPLAPLHLFGHQTAQTQDTIQEFMKKSESAQLIWTAGRHLNSREIM